MSPEEPGFEDNRVRLPKQVRDVQRQVNQRLSAMEWRVRIISLAYIPLLIMIWLLWQRTS